MSRKEGEDGSMAPVGVGGTNELLPSVYDDLRRVAARRLAFHPVGTLTATAVVHEAYLRLISANSSARWNSGRHFFCAAAEGIRRVLVEEARRKRTAKRGGFLVRRDFVESRLAAPSPDEDLRNLNEALMRLEHVHAPAARLVTLRYFSGFSVPEAAEILGVSVRTANRMWAYARSWLYEQLRA